MPTSSEQAAEAGEAGGTADTAATGGIVDRSLIEEFRANRGKVGGPFAGRDLLLLTTTAAVSGTSRTTVLDYVRRDGALTVLGSGTGTPDHPGWYRDLLAHPVVGVEIGTQDYQALAVPVRGPHDEELLAASPARIPPAVVLERADPEVWEGRPREIRTLADKVMEVHTWLRGQLRQVKAETDAHFAARAAHRGPGEPPAPGLGLQIRQRCLAFCQALEFHHTSEDDHLFPGIARYHPDLGETFDRLRDEHRTVARIQNDLAALLAGIGIADPEGFRSELHAMSAELNAHFDYEEETIVPLLTDVPWPPGPPADPSSAAPAAPPVDTDTDTDVGAAD
ncbi:nitroreductase/quinone reductase family protein [Streptomyces sp. NBC_01104]|uniref:nitroreductase/quinone reductase family protein n=1 Tax=Streptomyces sp. NBC_01104 TaxID=2903750 RepID=UPI0038670D26|nr:nitroreductase/quinone reductase family protein [Streptomyces sp. NBC_01104]